MFKQLSPELLIGTIIIILGIGFFIIDHRAATRHTLSIQELNDVVTINRTAADARITFLENELGIVASSTTSLAEELASTTLEQREHKTSLSEQLTTLSNSFDESITGLNVQLSHNDIAAVTARWEGYIYDLVCDFTVDNENTDSSGSATIEQRADGFYFITNKHVLTENNDAGETITPKRCELFKPELDIELDVDEETLLTNTDQDSGSGRIEDTDVDRFDTIGIMSGDFCTDTPTIGDNVVILGYPKIGSTSTITVTEGIISGFEAEYYITSAKIDQGHSGGAAIHVKNDCFLGLPTFVKTGRAESLARILPI